MGSGYNAEPIQPSPTTPTGPLLTVPPSRWPPVVICLLGEPDTGERTHARRLSRRFGLRLLSYGDMLRELARRRGGRDGRTADWTEAHHGLLRGSEEGRGAAAAAPNGWLVDRFPRRGPSARAGPGWMPPASAVLCLVYPDGDPTWQAADPDRLRVRVRQHGEEEALRGDLYCPVAHIYANRGMDAVEADLAAAVEVSYSQPC